MLTTRHITVALLLGCAAVLPAPAQDGPKPIRVLFIGNSFTFSNDLPGMLAELAKAGKQPPLEFTQETPGGVTLEKQWKDGKASKKIASGPWDYVVLQEQSQRPLTDRALMFEYAAKFDAEIMKHKAKVLLYQTWSRQDAPEKQDALSKAYFDLGKQLNARVAPVGMAWQNALKDNPKLSLHVADKSHPNKTGTYLAACVFYATIYGQTPQGLPGKIGGLSNEEADAGLQRIAWDTVRHVAEKK